MIIKEINFPIYSTLIVLSLGICFLFNYIFLRSNKVEKNIVLLSLITAITFIFVGGKLFTIITNLNEDINLITAGLSSYGGAIGLIISVYIFNKIYNKRKEIMYTSYILSLPLTYSIAKFACFAVGCCHGINYNGIFSVQYEKWNYVNMFPIQLVESIIFLTIFCIILILYKKYKYKYCIELTVISSALSKFVLDYLRASHINKILSVNQIISLIFIILFSISWIKKIPNNKKCI